MPQFNAILFDVDGTLVDSAPGILNSFKQTLIELDVNPENYDLMQYVGPPLRVSFANHFHAPEEVEFAAARYREIYKESGSFQCNLYPDVKEMLRTLKDAGFILCTATSKPTGVVTPILEHLGIASYFDFIGGASMDQSRDTKTAVISHVLAQPFLSAASTVMIGDRKEDLQGAANCNIPAVAALYGYGADDEFLSFTPLFHAKSCNELAQYLLTTKGE